MGYFVKNNYSNYIAKWKYINNMLKDDSKKFENMEKKIMVINIYTLKLSSNDKYYYIKTLKRTTQYAWLKTINKSI